MLNRIRFILGNSNRRYESSASCPSLSPWKHSSVLQQCQSHHPTSLTLPQIPCFSFSYSHFLRPCCLPAVLSRVTSQLPHLHHASYWPKDSYQGDGLCKEYMLKDQWEFVATKRVGWDFYLEQILTQFILSLLETCPKSQTRVPCLTCLHIHRTSQYFKG